MYSIEVKLHEDLHILTKVFGVYGYNIKRGRMTLQPHLLNAFSENAFITGDFNGTTSPFDTVGAALGGNNWTWFTHKENNLSLIDVFKSFWGEAHPEEHWPMTRVRGHEGKPCIDKPYLTKKAAKILHPTYGEIFHLPSTIDDTKTHSDHDMVVVSFHPWVNPPTRTVSCKGWNKANIGTFKHFMQQSFHTIPNVNIDEYLQSLGFRKKC